MLLKFLFKNSFTTFLCWIDQSIIFPRACPVYSFYNVNKLQKKNQKYSFPPISSLLFHSKNQLYFTPVLLQLREGRIVLIVLK